MWAVRRLGAAIAAGAAVLIAIGTAAIPASWLSGVLPVATGILVGSIIGLVIRARRWLTQKLRARGRPGRGRRAGREVAASTARPWRRYLVPLELPPPPAQFVGRAQPSQVVRDTLRQRRWSARPIVINVHGEAGVGKSAFIVHVATSLIGRFPDGIVYSSLTGTDPDSERLFNVAGDLVDSLQGPGETVPSTMPERVRELRHLSRRWPRVLYVMDDVRSGAVIRPILPVAVRSAVLVSSIEPLAGLPARVKVLSLPLGVLTQDEAVGLFTGLLGQPKLGAPAQEAVRRIVNAAARLPLALHLAARAINSRGLWALTEVADLLPEHSGADPEFAADRDQTGDHKQVEVGAGATMLDLSIEVLNARQKRVFLALDMLPADMRPFVPWMVRELVNAGESESEQISDDDVWNICERLADQRLLERINADATGVVRFRVTDRVQSYLTARTADSPTRHRAVDRDEARAAARDLLRRRTAERIRAYHAGGGFRRREAEIHQHLLQGRIADALDEARGALADVREAKEAEPERTGTEPAEWTGAEARGRAAHWAGSGLMSDDERAAMAALAEVLSELGGLDDSMEIASKDRRMRAARGHPDRSAPQDLAAARTARMLGRIHRRQLKLGPAADELGSAIRIASKLGASGVEEEIVATRELALVRSMRGAGNIGEPRDAYQLIQHAQDALLPRVADRGARQRLTCRLREASAVVRLQQVDFHGGPPALLDEADELLVSAIKDLDAEFVLWHAWFLFHRAGVVRKQAEKIQLDSGDIDIGRQRFASARRLAQDAVGRFSAMKHRYGTARCRLEIGQTYVLNRPEVAIPLLEDARETFIFCGDRWIEARTALTLAAARFRQDPESEAGHNEFTFALRVFTALDDAANLEEVEHISASLSSRS